MFDKGPGEAEFDVEMQEHLKLLAEQYQRWGMNAEDAKRAARRQFGNTTLLREERRAMGTIPGLENLWSDLVYGLRMLRKNPGFATASVVTLALGIGANTTIFSIFNAVLLKPLPYADPGRLVMLWEHPRGGAPHSVAPANFMDWREQTHSFDHVAAVGSSSNLILTGQGDPARLKGATVSADFFSLLGVRLLSGRSFLAAEEDTGRDHVVILSYRTWRERFGARADMLGKQVSLSDSSYTVVGILPEDFLFTTKASDFLSRNQFDVWVPLSISRARSQRGTHPYRVLARLKSGVELVQAQAELNVLGDRLASQYPADNKGKGITAIPLTEQVTGSVRPALGALLGAVGFLLLIACANVANLLLSRAAAREKEMAVRVALGAGRRRLVQQLLTESLLLASLGGLGGFLLAWAAIAFLSSRVPADLSRAAGISMDARTLGFTALVVLATGVLFGLAPLCQAGGRHSNESLKQNSRGTGGSQSRMRSVLVVAQRAIAMVLLVGAGLMVKSFWTLLQVSPGFRTERILTARLTLPRSRYPDNHRIAAFQQDLLTRVRNSPGVRSAGFATYLPLSGTDNGWAFFIEGRPPHPIGVWDSAKYRPACPGYFETIGIPLLQ